MAYATAESKVGKYADVPVWNKKGEIKEGAVVEGEIVDVEEFTTKYGTMTTYIIGTADAKLVKLNGQTDLRNKMQDVADHRSELIGTKVRITYTGITETANGAMKVYNVEYEA